MKVKNQTQTNVGSSSEENVITTRFRAAQQQKLNNANNNSLNTPGTSQQQQQTIEASFSLPTSRSHRLNQHSIGKIVKPIPVRPLSSSSSSTHSSTFSGVLVKPLIPNLLDAANAPYSTFFQSSSSNFSLIAKYFASFPATRLKTAETTLLATSTPFLPFSKPKTDAHHPNNPGDALSPANQTLPTSLLSEQHLCTNFRRMIKLNEEKSQRAETPVLNESDECPRVGQITMETRSTRKFIIKHHPYLQQQQQQPTKSPKIERPSINLIKMKKLKGQKSVDNNNEEDEAPLLPTTPLNNRSGRSSRSNNSGNISCDVDDLLLKFTDKAPINANNKKNTTTDNINMNKKKKLKEENEYFFVSPASDLECDECGDNNEEEDSSGYYSSYHSVDHKSSAGGSVNGEKNKLIEPKAQTQTTPLNNNNNTSNNTNRPSLHHYPTRFSSNFLQAQNLPKNNSHSNSQNSRKQHLNTKHKNLECDIDIDEIEND